MKIRDIISEAQTKLRQGAQDAVPNMQRYDSLDNSNPYHAYRFGIALAGAPAMGMNKDGPVGQKMVTIGYTEADDAICDAAARIMGAKPTQLTSDGSQEMAVINTQSPIQPKGPVKRKGK